ncbi:YbdK family carboxylate-amine ligase [Trabulsiella odontotermitis]|uniref:YbdK family carboxylate-amine ligase n=1 Tax=Trabulsiella odontotermitis TaxID=379893 RepID=UPI000675FB3B|nr:YbdK family carboxylate-amine ligase [Trabulsiella odontotermitis]KNC89105.1 gamma-glutamyl ligase [Trabulsiella odontotermitis]
MSLPDFHVSDPFTLGIELELQVVTPPGYDLSQDSATLIDAAKADVKAGEVKHDITESMLEIATGVCKDIHQASAQFAAIQQILLRAADAHHLQICGGGGHLEHFGYLVRQATVFGQHVHVGCQSGDDAIYLLHGLSRFVPHFIAINATSPWSQGSDTQFASSRLNIFSAFPDMGAMPWVSNWQQFEGLFRRLSYTSMIDGIKDLHWDIRPSPDFGTVEVRVMDTPLTLAQAVNMAGLLPTISEDITRLLDKIAPYGDKLGASSALKEIARQVKQGEGEAQGMRQFIADGGSLIQLVQKHCEIWAASA